MAYRRNYAYGIMVGGQKRIGGTVTADTMEDAVRAVVARKKGRLVSEPEALIIRGCDGASVRQAKWLFDGKKSDVYVWAPPEYF